MRVDLIVVGAGLSGAAFLAHLLRDHPHLRGRIAVIEPRRRLGAGLAYGTCDPAHRVNVAAGRMSLFPDAPDHFVQWLDRTGTATHDREALGGDGLLHPRRALFGRYVDETLRAAIAASEMSVANIRATAMQAERHDGEWRVILEGGDRIDAPVMVLAVGHTLPALPSALAGLAGTTGLIPDPWQRDALQRIGRDSSVLVVGTGLTGCDVVASLRHDGHRGPIAMVSRRGLLPRPRTHLPVAPFGRFDDPPARTALALLRSVRAAIAAADALGRPWEDVIAALREQARTVWGSLPIGERRSLLRHLRPFWDVHRFQCAPQIDRVIREGLAEGWLTVRAAALRGARSEAGRIEIILRPKRGAPESLSVDAVVNCTGPGHRSVVDVHPMLRTLAEAGALRADPCRLGIDVDDESRVLASDGTAWPDLFVAGPLARGTHGELMGLPQVAEQPRAVSRRVASLLAASPDGIVRNTL